MKDPRECPKWQAARRAYDLAEVVVVQAAVAWRMNGLGPTHPPLAESVDKLIAAIAEERQAFDAALEVCMKKRAR